MYSKNHPLSVSKNSDPHSKREKKEVGRIDGSDTLYDMKLVLARHAEAEDGMIDFDRRLTDRGITDIGKMAIQLAGTGWNFRDIRHSPLVRTSQTAKIVQERLEMNTEIMVPIYEERKLSPGFPVADVVPDLLSEYEYKDAALWVFHAPEVSIVASHILGLPERCFYFPPGAMLALNLSLPVYQERSMLIWMMQPEYVEHLDVHLLPRP